MAAEGHTQTFIGECFGIEASVAARIIRGETYKDFPGPITIIERAPRRFRGVYLDRRRGKWEARLRHNNECLQIGTFSSEIEAARAWNNAVIKHNLNRPLNQLTDPTPSWRRF
jgi:hypothetical protein